MTSSNDFDNEREKSENRGSFGVTHSCRNGHETRRQFSFSLFSFEVVSLPDDEMISFFHFAYFYVPDEFHESDIVSIAGGCHRASGCLDQGTKHLKHKSRVKINWELRKSIQDSDSEWKRTRGAKVELSASFLFISRALGWCSAIFIVKSAHINSE